MSQSISWPPTSKLTRDDGGEDEHVRIHRGQKTIYIAMNSITQTYIALVKFVLLFQWTSGNYGNISRSST